MSGRAAQFSLLLIVPLAVLLSTGWTWPVDPLPGGRAPVVVDPFDAPAHAYGPGHRGTDLSARPDAVVRAPAAGVVVLAEEVAGVPVTVIAHGASRNPQELRSTLQPTVAQLPVGTLVRAGQAVGRLGSWPGHCAEPCLHWGVRRGLDYLDPQSLIAGPVRLLPLGAPVSRSDGQLAPPDSFVGSEESDLADASIGSGSRRSAIGPATSFGASADPARSAHPPEVHSSPAGPDEIVTGSATAAPRRGDSPPPAVQAAVGITTMTAALAAGSALRRRRT